MRSAEELIDIFSRLRVSTAGNRRAPHKPLLVLLVPALWRNTGQLQFRYGEIGHRLGLLLREFVPPKVKKPGSSQSVLLPPVRRGLAPDCAARGARPLGLESTVEEDLWRV